MSGAPRNPLLVIRRGGTPDEIRTLAATLIVFGIAAVLALPATDPIVPTAAKVDYDGGTWAFLAVNVAPVLVGLALFSAVRTRAPVATPA